MNSKILSTVLVNAHSGLIKVKILTNAYNAMSTARPVLVPIITIVNPVHKERRKTAIVS